MKTIKEIILILGLAVNVGFYAAFFVTFFDESVSETTSLLLLIAAMVMSILINQGLNELKDN